MKKKILLYCWGAHNEGALKRAIEENGYACITFLKKMQDYHADSCFSMEFLNVLHAEKIDAVLGYDYFPLISMLCEINKIPYISWIYDCPQLTLQSVTLKNSNNYIFCFDRLFTERLVQMGAQNCFHFPLAGDDEFGRKIDDILKNNSDIEQKYHCDISFVGNLYNGDKNRLRKASLPEYIRGYLEGIIHAQLQVYGYNFIKETLSDEITSELVEQCQLKLGDMYLKDDRQMAADVIGMEISAREREQALNLLGEKYEVRVYTGSNLPEALATAKVKNMGYADYDREMPLIFRESRINVNITSKTIESGVPMRVFDILSCNGFCMTNYQSEIAELFEDGKDLVMYTSMEDMIEKVGYYLNHEEERREIAESGAKKIKEYSMQKKIEQIFDIALGGRE